MYVYLYIYNDITALHGFKTEHKILFHILSSVYFVMLHHGICQTLHL